MKAHLMILVLLVALAATVLPESPLFMGANAQSSCYQPLCTDGRWPNYAYRDGVDSTGPYGACNSNSSPPAPMSHILAHCPAGSTLVAGAGLCHVDACGGAGCEHRSVCTDPRWPRYRAGHDGRDATGPTANCSSTSSAPAPISHIVARCPSGFDLVAGVGVCRRCPLAMAPGGAPTPAPIARPDLTLRTVWLHTQASSAHVTTLRRGTAYYACFTAANIGSAASGVFRVGGGGLGVPTAPYQNQAGLGPGATRNGCLLYPTTPPPGTYRLGLSADSLRVVAETREDNNDATITVTVIP